MAKIILSLGLLTLIVAQTPHIHNDWLDTLPNPWTLSPQEMNKLLPIFQERFPDFQERLKYIALWRVGTPYEIFKLGEEIEPDTDPVIRYDVSDCTAHILTSLAAAQASTWDEAYWHMVDIHYKVNSNGQKEPTYKSRWHYTVDRITDNPYTVDMSQELIPITSMDSVLITLNQKQNGEAFLDLDWQRPMMVHYIPNREINTELLAKLPTIAGVAFIKPSYFKMGLVTGHEGMLIDGTYLVHASQSEGKTVKVDFLSYYFQKTGPIFGGIMIFEFKQNH